MPNELILNDLNSFLRTGGVPGVDDTMYGPGQSKAVLTNTGTLLFYDFNGNLIYNLKHNVCAIFNMSNQEKTYIVPYLNMKEAYDDVVNNWGPSGAVGPDETEFRLYLSSLSTFFTNTVTNANEMIILPTIRLIKCYKSSNYGDEQQSVLYNMTTNQSLNNLAYKNTPFSTLIRNSQKTVLRIRLDGDRLVVWLLPDRNVLANWTPYIVKPSPADILYKDTLYGVAGTSSSGIFGTGGVIPAE